MLESVTGEEFDLVVSNPPFVITPWVSELSQFTYRDGGHCGDGIVRELITEVRSMLAPGGVAQIPANWEVHGEEDIFDRISGWLVESGLDGWVIGREHLDVAEYAETWLRDGGLSPDRDHRAWEQGLPRGWTISRPAARRPSDSGTSPCSAPPAPVNHGAASKK